MSLNFIALQYVSLIFILMRNCSWFVTISVLHPSLGIDYLKEAEWDQEWQETAKQILRDVWHKFYSDEAKKKKANKTMAAAAPGKQNQVPEKEIEAPSHISEVTLSFFESHDIFLFHI